MNPEIEGNYNNLIKKEPESYLQLRLSNLAAFIVCMLMNSFQSTISVKDPRQISDELDLRIQPAFWAFSIWGIIYTLILVYVVYQTLQKDRESYKLLFEKIGYNFVVNQLSNGLWLLIFNQGSTIYYWLSFPLMIVILFTCCKIMEISVNEPNNCIEFLTIRIAFSIYSGWVTAATILNVSIALKSAGLDDSVIDEASCTIAILYIAWVIYLLISLKYKNPVYSAVYIWVLVSIKSRQQKLNVDGQLDSLITNLLILMTIQVIQVCLHFLFLINQKFISKQYVNHGIFY